LASGSFFGEDERKQLIAACIPRTRLHIGDFLIDIVEDRRSQPRLFLCVVQRQGSPEVLFLGQFSQEPDAQAAARQFIANQLRAEEQEA